MKPVVPVVVTSTDLKRRKLPALLDSGSFYTLVRLDCVPSNKAILRRARSDKLGTAGRRGGLTIVGDTVLVVAIGKKRIRTPALVSSDMKREFLIGAETMQAWDISIHSRTGKTRVVVGRDMRDPDVIEVACVGPE